MELKKIWLIVIFVICFERSSSASNVNVLNNNHSIKSRIKRSRASDIYLALPPDTEKIGKQNAPPTLIHLDPNSPIKFKGKFPTPIERFIQRIQNYFSVYNPPEYLNDLRPGINNPDNDNNTFVNDTNNTHVILPCNGTSTIIIIPVPFENENVTNEENAKPVSSNQSSNGFPDSIKPAVNEQSTPKSSPPCDELLCPHASTPTPVIPDEVTTPKHNCQENTTTPNPKRQETTQKEKIPETITKKSPCPDNKNTGSKPSGYGPNEVPPINLVAQPISPSEYHYKKPISTPASTYLPPYPPSPAYYVASTSPPCTGYPHKPKQLPPILRLKQMLFPRLFAALHSDDY
ncbi:uncharacterized protein LOC126895643 [Daktulosphaira vitifoliae]|uniref:uncharacterized protein LOC126895643 n=1 Tax=Daktulosphaira vitifoliae TaxID=58002 RepID=UPI0021A9CFCA|nr:uncharacterized protein LOC126895643 [Daktulosphaira vitifoliae]